eukprot:TRINITY_DN31516_c0_g1_i1.p1 TRINITY_DN31516_c0_g1~~TRINITY_DN31516_c0_g1_i1.p1  ORF type:complete len:352 (+),score=50.69 TRINITY_DN31516_c0_g1_i1:122-1177(+)
MVIAITNLTDYTCRAWVSSKDLFPGSQTSWYALPKDEQVSWNRNAANRVTIEVSGKTYKHQSGGNSTLEIRDDGIYFDDKKETSFNNEAVLIPGATCDSGVNLTNETDMRVRAWVTSGDLIPGSQTSWYSAKKDKTLTWNRNTNNVVTIEVEGFSYLHYTAGTPGSNLYVKEDGIYFGEKREHVLGFRHTVVVASSPVRGRDGKDYKQCLRAIAEKHTNVKIGMDWPGSSTADPQDVPLFQQMEQYKALYLNSSTSPAERMQAFEAIKSLVKSTLWWNKYLGLIISPLRTALQENNNVDLVCIQGGPISQVECAEMESIKNMALHDARELNENANISLKVYKNIEDFTSSL